MVIIPPDMPWDDPEVWDFTDEYDENCEGQNDRDDAGYCEAHRDKKAHRCYPTGIYL